MIGSVRSRLQLSWSVKLAQKVREVALSAKSNVLYAKVSGHSTKSLQGIGGSCVRLDFQHAPLQEGGWVVGIRAAHADEDGFLPALGGAPGDQRHGRLDTILMASPLATAPAAEPQVTFLAEDLLMQHFPIGMDVVVAPIWQCNDFFNLRRLFASLDEAGSGAIDAAEVSELIRRETALPPSDDEVAALIAAANAESGSSETITFDALRKTRFYQARMCARIEQLAERAAARVESMHECEPWRGQLAVEAGSFDALVHGTQLARTTSKCE